MEIQDVILAIMELLGTMAFAVSGAMAGIRKKMDMFGICVLGAITATGGGIIRDIILGITPPEVFVIYGYAGVAVSTSLLVFTVIYFKNDLMNGKFKAVYDRVMLVMDTVGLAAFTVTGVTVGIQQGYEDQLFLLAFVGTITGVGGGVLRDLMTGELPYIFVKHIYAIASLAGSVVCVYMHRFFGPAEAMIVSCIVVLVIRYLAAHYHWNLPAVFDIYDNH